MIFDCVIGSSIQYFGYLSPLVARASMKKEEDPLLFEAPSYFLNLRIQMVVPSLTALLPNTSGKVLRNLSPLLWSMCLHQLKHQSIFLFCPWSLHQTGVKHFLPSMKALNVSSTRKRFGNLLPVFASMLIHCSAQHMILLLGPMALYQPTII